MDLCVVPVDMRYQFAIGARFQVSGRRPTERHMIKDALRIGKMERSLRILRTYTKPTFFKYGLIGRSRPPPKI